MVRLATLDDLDFLDQHDPLLARSALADKIAREENYVVEWEGQLVGWARYNLFCDLDPFLTRRRQCDTRKSELLTTFSVIWIRF